ncbi:acyltransferase family protein [Lysobacter sp. A289]
MTNIPSQVIVESSRPPAPRARLGELDALRGVAALAVVAFHYTTSYAQQVGHVEPLPFGFAAGNYGVHLFFLISGYVIFMTLERTRDAMDFVVSRFSRLYPAYWASMGITVAVVSAIGLPDQQLATRELLLNLTMVQQFLGAGHLDGSYWTLQVELFFYAQMLFWFAVGQLRRIHWIIGAWLVLAAIQGVVMDRGLHFSYSVRELLILRHIPFFALGILFYRLHDKAGERGLNLVMIGLSLVAISIAQGGVLLLVGLACCAVFALFVSGYLRFLCIWPFAWLGAISYPLYLLHQTIGIALIHWLEQHGVPSMVTVAMALVVALALATLVTWRVERPVMLAIRMAWRQHRTRLAPA